MKTAVIALIALVAGFLFTEAASAQQPGYYYVQPPVVYYYPPPPQPYRVHRVVECYRGWFGIPLGARSYNVYEYAPPVQVAPPAPATTSPATQLPEYQFAE